MSHTVPVIGLMGDATSDVYVDTREVRQGGAAVNMAMWAKRLRAEPLILSAIGTDVIGKKTQQFFKKEKLSSLGVQVKRGSTSSIEIFLKDGERRYGTWKPGVLTKYHLRPQDKKRLAAADAIVITIYPKYEHVLREFALWKQTLPEGKRPLFVINYGDLKEFENSLEVVRQHIELADILVFGLDKDEDETHINAIRDMATNGRLCIVTLGSFGSIAWKDGHTYTMIAHETKVVDTTGAGDAFLMGFMKSYITSSDVTASLKAGSTLAAKVIQKIGAY